MTERIVTAAVLISGTGRQAVPNEKRQSTCETRARVRSDEFEKIFAAECKKIKEAKTI